MSITTRLGYACINMTMKEENKKHCCNRTCRLATAIKAGTESGYPKGSVEYSSAVAKFLAEYGRHNLTEMYKIISWSRKNGIFFYRMSSSMFPHVNNHRIQEHMIPEHWEWYGNLEFGRDIIHQIGLYAQKYQIRLTMHPGHHNHLGSDKTDVIQNTFADLIWHGKLLKLLFEGAEAYRKHQTQTGKAPVENILNHGILCIHGGGTYGDKEITLRRWKQNFLKLPEYVQKRIALENDERNYSAEDLMPLCNELQIPMIFDFHHYNCWAYYHESNPHQKPIKDLLPLILNTWKVRNMIPKFHLSDQAAEKKIGAHHDYVESIPNELLNLMTIKYRFDIMIEAKQKEKATIRLMKKYHNILTRNIITS